MAWVTPSTRSTGDLITAAIWNSDVVNNPIALAPTTKGQWVLGDGSDPAKLGVGANGLVPIADSGESVGVKWGDAESLIKRWLNADDFHATSGAPGLTNYTPAGAGATTAITAWAFDDGSIEQIGTSIVIPAGITAVTFDVYWAMLNAAAGDVVFRFMTQAIAIGESNSNTAGIENDTVAVPGTTLELKVTTYTPSTTIAAGDLVGLGFGRAGDDEADTAANDMYIAGVLVNFS